jgi:nitroimidazol reductase NimA-like FMN-containing flavoprotein (pyridoxamine 5'-phosphate oxidase superfamily)
MRDQPTDHAGLETLPFDVCLRLLASVPIGRIGFHADGEVVLLPVNHAVDGHDVVFRTASGSKLTAAGEQGLVAFEADDYDLRTRSGWSVLVTGRAMVVYDEAEVSRLDRLNLHPWAAGVERPFWIRIHPTSVTGRRTSETAGSSG